MLITVHLVQINLNEKGISQDNLIAQRLTLFVFILCDGWRHSPSSIFDTGVSLDFRFCLMCIFRQYFAFIHLNYLQTGPGNKITVGASCFMIFYILFERFNENEWKTKKKYINDSTFLFSNSIFIICRNFGGMAMTKFGEDIKYNFVPFTTREMKRRTRTKKRNEKYFLIKNNVMVPEHRKKKSDILFQFW